MSKDCAKNSAFYQINIMI